MHPNLHIVANPSVKKNSKRWIVLESEAFYLVSGILWWALFGMYLMTPANTTSQTQMSDNTVSQEIITAHAHVKEEIDLPFEY